MIVALSIHSFMDGLAIYAGTRTGSELGILVLFAVVFHKIPEGMALSLVALGSGAGRRRAFLTTLTVESVTTISGGLAGLLFFIPQDSPWLGYIMGHVGGGFIFLVIHALLAETIKRHPRFTILSALGGALSIGIVGFLIGAF
jgi:zinc transporter ZupT